MLHDPLEQLMEDIWGDGNIDIGMQQGLPERMLDWLDSSLSTGGMKGADITDIG